MNPTEKSGITTEKFEPVIPMRKSNFDRLIKQAQLSQRQNDVKLFVEFLEKYFSNQKVYLPDLDVYATEIIQQKLAELKSELNLNGGENGKL